MEEYKFQKYLDYANLYFENKKSLFSYSLLSKPSDQAQTVGGFCRFSAVNDVCTTHFRIYEAIRDPKLNNYFGNYFDEELSEPQLANTKHETIEDLIDFMMEIGVTNKRGYARKDLEVNGKSWFSKEKKIVKEFNGCRRFKMSGLSIFSGECLDVSIEDLENGQNYLFTGAMKKTGTAVGTFPLDNSYQTMCDVPIYTPNMNDLWYEDGLPIHHAVMLTGYGVATHLPTQTKSSYFEFQNNWGPKNTMGKVICSALVSAYIPRITEDPTIKWNLNNFMDQDGNSLIRLVNKEDLKHK